MSLRHSVILGGAIAVAMLAIPSALKSQDCVGKKPKGGRWVTSAELYMQQARSKAKPEDARKKWQETADVLEEGFEKQPDNPKNYMMAGQAYAELGRFEDADAAFTKAVDMWSCYTATVDTFRYRAWTKAWNLGVRYSQAEDDEAAIEYYNNAWTLYDKLPQPMLQLGMIYADRALTADAEEEQGHYEALAVYAYQNALEAVQDAPRISEAQRQEFSSAAAFNLAQILALRERYEDAARSFDAYLEIAPGDVMAMSNAAVVLIRGADQAADQAAEMEDGPEKEVLLAKSDSLRAVAQGHYDALLAREDLTAQEYHNIGLGLNRIGMPEQAITAFRMALDVDAYRMNTLEQLARAYMGAAKWDSLAAVAQVLVERYPMNMDNLALLANAYREMDQSNDALAVLEQREALGAELTDLELEAEEGVYTVNGYIHNMKLEASTEVVVEFDFLDESGEVVATEATTLVAPEQNSQAEFSVSTDSSALITGFVYRPVSGAQAQAGG